jgi:hypothetical protein
MRLEVVSPATTLPTHTPIGPVRFCADAAAYEEGEPRIPSRFRAPKLQFKLPTYFRLPHTEDSRAARVGASPGKPFLFLIPATGKSAVDLLRQLACRKVLPRFQTGIISGRIKTAGTYKVQLGASGPWDAISANSL